jgi:hypothetical protein
MTRGPQPLLALREARDLGSERGTVGDMLFMQDAGIDLTIVCLHAVVFVKIKRTRILIHDICDITAQYSREITHLRRIPLSPVVCSELWVRSQRGTWRYFRVRQESMVEIRSDGTIIAGLEKDIL